MICERKSGHRAQTARTPVRLAIMVVAVLASFWMIAGPAFAGNAPEQQLAAKVPDRPTKVKVVSVRDYSCEVSWKGVKSAELYQIQYKKANASKWRNAAATNDTWAEIDGLDCDTKYQVRVRAVNGKKKSGWSAAAKFTTKLEMPRAIWASYVDSDTITIMWTPSAKARKYRITWYQDNPGEDGRDPVVTTKRTSYTFDGLSEEGSYTFIVKAVNGGKSSPANAILLSTYSEESGIIMKLKDYPTSPFVSLTRFISGHDSIPGSEREFPALYATYYDSEGDVTDDGFFFVDAKLQQATLYYGTVSQYNPANPGEPFEELLTAETVYRVGDSIRMPNGETATITGLTMQLLPNEVFENCADADEAYDRVEEYQLWISTDSGKLHDPIVSWTPWRVH